MVQAKIKTYFNVSHVFNVLIVKSQQNRIELVTRTVVFQLDSKEPNLPNSPPLLGGPGDHHQNDTDLEVMEGRTGSGSGGFRFPIEFRVVRRDPRQRGRLRSGVSSGSTVTGTTTTGVTARTSQVTGQTQSEKDIKGEICKPLLSKLTLLGFFF